MNKAMMPADLGMGEASWVSLVELWECWGLRGQPGPLKGLRVGGNKEPA